MYIAATFIRMQPFTLLFKSYQIKIICILVKKASNTLGVAENSMKHPRKRQTEDCTNKKCRENCFFLPLYIKRWTCHEVDGNGCECNRT